MEETTNDQESIANEGNVEEPSPKRQCMDGQNKAGTKEVADVSQIPLPIPDYSPPVVQHLNVIERGSVHHDYGSGHHQVNITHCDTMGNQNIGMGMPHVYVQPHFNEDVNYREFDRKVVRHECYVRLIKRIFLLY